MRAEVGWAAREEERGSELDIVTEQNIVFKLETRTTTVLPLFSQKSFYISLIKQNFQEILMV